MYVADSCVTTGTALVGAFHTCKCFPVTKAHGSLFELSRILKQADILQEQGPLGAPVSY